METVRIAHISDLHFGCAANHQDTWRHLRQHLEDDTQPDLILVTGDLADTVDIALYDDAKNQLDLLSREIARKRQQRDPVPYYVCAGNHDRHLTGLAEAGVVTWVIYRLKRLRRKTSSAEFDRLFTGRIPSLNAPVNVSLGTAGNRWNLRILGMDSSISADAYARGCRRVCARLHHGRRYQESAERDEQCRRSRPRRDARSSSLAAHPGAGKGSPGELGISPT